MYIHVVRSVRRALPFACQIQLVAFLGGVIIFANDASRPTSNHTSNNPFFLLAENKLFRFSLSSNVCVASLLNCSWIFNSHRQAAHPCQYACSSVHGTKSFGTPPWLVIQWSGWGTCLFYFFGNKQVEKKQKKKRQNNFNGPMPTVEHRRPKD